MSISELEAKRDQYWKKILDLEAWWNQQTAGYRCDPEHIRKFNLETTLLKRDFDLILSRLSSEFQPGGKESKLFKNEGEDALRKFLNQR